MYQSEFTQFMNEYLHHHPEVDAQRRELRLTWWDKVIDLEAHEEYKNSQLRQKPYVYQSM
jgi:hypothetical protein